MSRLGIAGLALSMVAAHPAAPVIGGDKADGYTPVVALTGPLGLPFCSGTLISPRVVLTAAHCVDGAPARVYVGAEPADHGVFVEVEIAEQHPDYDEASFRADLGLVRLARPIPLVAPPIGVAAAAPWAALFVGFGFTEGEDHGELGIKHAARATIDELDAGTLFHGSVACNGDSGGPVFAEDGAGLALIGVVSRGESGCLGRGAAVRADAFRDWIDARVAALDPPACGLDRRCAADCVTVDPDCALEVGP